MSHNPYKIEGPAVVSFSGGRTSGFMLWHILDAWGSELPEDVKVAFMNTGLEHEATLQFVRDCASYWSLDITWLEFDVVDGERTFKIVDFCSASRDGQPMRDMASFRGYLPNPVSRSCTSDLKLKTMHSWIKTLGWEEWDTAVGLRADEPHRAKRIKPYIKAETPLCPVYEAGHTEKDVLEFWKAQDFDLMLPGGNNTFGNCVGCFLKARHKLEKIGLTNPEHLETMADIEEEAGSVFRQDRPKYSEILTQITLQGRLFDDVIDDDTLPCSCHD